jgi:hypothetical protein
VVGGDDGYDWLLKDIDGIPWSGGCGEYEPNRNRGNEWYSFLSGGSSKVQAAAQPALKDKDGSE